MIFKNTSAFIIIFILLFFFVSPVFAEMTEIEKQLAEAKALASSIREHYGRGKEQAEMAKQLEKTKKLAENLKGWKTEAKPEQVASSASVIREQRKKAERLAKSVRDGWQAYKIPTAETAKSDAPTIQTASLTEEAVIEVKEAADEEEAETQIQPALSTKFVRKSKHGLALNVSFRNSRDELVPRHLVRDEQIRQEYLSFLMDACLRHGVPPVLPAVVIRVESSWDKKAISEKGAISLAQLMPETALELEVDPYNPEENIAGGVKYLAFLLKKFNNDVELAVASYNCGYGRVSELLKKHGRKNVVRYLPEETQQYLRKVRQVANIKAIDI